MSCGCEGNKDLKSLERMRKIAEKAAKMDDCVYILYKKDDIYYFCKEGESFNGNLIEYIFP